MFCDKTSLELSIFEKNSSWLVPTAAILILDLTETLKLTLNLPLHSLGWLFCTNTTKNCLDKPIVEVSFFACLASLVFSHWQDLLNMYIYVYLWQMHIRWLPLNEYDALTLNILWGREHCRLVKLPLSKMIIKSNYEFIA